MRMLAVDKDAQCGGRGPIEGDTGVVAGGATG